MAYSNYRWQMHERFAETTEMYWTTLDTGDAFLHEHPEFGLSTYDATGMAAAFVMPPDSGPS